MRLNFLIIKMNRKELTQRDFLEDRGCLSAALYILIAMSQQLLRPKTRVQFPEDMMII